MNILLFLMTILKQAYVFSNFKGLSPTSDRLEISQSKGRPFRDYKADCGHFYYS